MGLGYHLNHEHWGLSISVILEAGVNLKSNMAFLVPLATQF